MTNLEANFLIQACFKGFSWAYFGLDIPEWTKPEYYHQN